MKQTCIALWTLFPLLAITPVRAQPPWQQLQQGANHLQQVMLQKIKPWWQPFAYYQYQWQMKQVLTQLSPSVVIRVSKRSQLLQLEDRGQVVAQFPVSTGTFNNTPEGHFRIISRVKDPSYTGSKHLGRSYYPSRHPNNPLGNVWFGLNVGHYRTGVAIGIHGTDEPQYIGQAVSAGCVRMHNDDALMLFPYIRVGTRVVISPD